MKTNLIITGLLLLIISSCSSPKYLPSANLIDENQYGSYIRVFCKNSDSNLKGELIAIDTNKIVVLSKYTNTCETVAIKDVKRFKLRYAKAKHYGWSLPIGIALPVIHGLLSVFTVPLHVAVTSVVTVSGENAFQYSHRNMTYQKLRMFARFPQGIPPNIEMANIK